MILFYDKAKKYLRVYSIVSAKPLNDSFILKSSLKVV